MTPRERLLERIDRWEGAPQQRGRDDAACVHSVLTHLQRLLNTRRGNVPIAADFGAPDFLMMLQAFPQSVSAIEDAIRAAVEQYEPRLANVEVRFQPDEVDRLVLRFEIAAALAPAVERRVSFATSIDLQGKVLITEQARRASEL